MKRVRRSLVALVAVPALLVTACEQEQSEVPEVPGVASPTSDGSQTRTPVRDEVPEACDDLVTYTRLLELIAVPMDGSSDRVYNDDLLESSGRTARLTCSFGVPFDTSDPAATPSPGVTPAPLPPPALVIALSSYTDAEVAAGRVDTTVVDAQGRGGRAVARPLGDVPGFFLTDDEDASYIVADGPLTYVFIMRRGLVPAGEEEVTLVAVAEEVVGVEDVSPTPTPGDSTPSTPPNSTVAPTGSPAATATE